MFQFDQLTSYSVPVTITARWRDRALDMARLILPRGAELAATGHLADLLTAELALDLALDDLLLLKVLEDYIGTSKTNKTNKTKRKKRTGVSICCARVREFVAEYNKVPWIPRDPIVSCCINTSHKKGIRTYT